SRKQDDKTKKEAKGKSLVESFTRYRDLSAEFEDCFHNNINEVNVTGSIVPTVGQNSPNSTSTFSAAGPSNAAASQTYRKSSFIDASQLPDDLDIPKLEDITYSDDENDVGAEADFNNLETSITEEPKRVHQALKDPSWIKAIQEELLQFKMQKVWVLVDLPHKKKPLEEGIDYEEVFASVVKIEAYRLVLAYASFMGFMVYQMDVKSAFLYGTIEKKFMFVNLQGLRILIILTKSTKWSRHFMVYIKLLELDDIIFGATNKDLCKSFEKLMKDKFQMSSMGELTFFLGLQVKQKKDWIFISQDKYVAEILRKFRLTEGKSVSTPIDTEKSLLKDPDGEDVDVHTYRSMIGSLMYLTSSRPDIMLAVCACARFQVTPKASHLHAVKRIFRYLKGKPHLGLWYPKDSPFDLVVYSDSDYASASLDRKSTTGGCQILGCRLISWQCKKQTVVATSSKEVEYVATASYCAQVLWIQNQLMDYGHKLLLFSQMNWCCSFSVVRSSKVDCLPNEEIFVELARMGYENPSTKLTFYKAFFSSQWKFLIHTILQSMSAKCTSWNEFSSAMASAVICLSTGDLSNHTTKYTSPALTQNVFSNMRRVGKGFLGVETPLFEGMLVAREPEEQGDVEEQLQDNVNDVAQGANTTVSGDDVQDQSIPSPTPLTPLPPTTSRSSIHITVAQALEITKLKKRVKKLERANKERMIADLDRDTCVALMDDEGTEKKAEDAQVAGDKQVKGRQAEIYQIDMDHASKVLSMQEDEPEVQESVDVVTTAKLITEVVVAVSESVTAVSATIVAVPAATITTAPVRVAAASTRRRKGVVIRDPEEEFTAIIPAETKSKDEGKGIMVEEPKPMKKRPQTESQARRNMIMYLKNVAGFR
nr:hypothetical protein [Tanacetum cinerariifolium]